MVHISGISGVVVDMIHASVIIRVIRSGLLQRNLLLLMLILHRLHRLHRLHILHRYVGGVHWWWRCLHFVGLVITIIVV